MAEPGDAPFDGAIDAPSLDSIPGLVPWYPLDDAGFAGMAIDASGGDAACVSCLARAAGRVGGAAAFDGDDALRVAHAPGLDGMTGFTIAAWVYADVLDGFHAVVSKPVGPTDNNSWEFRAPGHARDALQARHGIARLYFDGTLIASQPHPTIPWDDGDVFIGADLNSGSAPATSRAASTRSGSAIARSPRRSSRASLSTCSGGTAAYRARGSPRTGGAGRRRRRRRTRSGGSRAGTRGRRRPGTRARVSRRAR